MTEFSPGTSPPPVSMPMLFFATYDSLRRVSAAFRYLCSVNPALSGNAFLSWPELKRQWIGGLLHKSTASASNHVLKNPRDSAGRCPQFLANLGGTPPGSGTAALANMH